MTDNMFDKKCALCGDNTDLWFDSATGSWLCVDAMACLLSFEDSLDLGEID
jgi:hypothetical protein